MNAAQASRANPMGGLPTPVVEPAITGLVSRIEEKLRDLAQLRGQIECAYHRLAAMDVAAVPTPPVTTPGYPPNAAVESRLNAIAAKFDSELADLATLAKRFDEAV